jgi:hypothetical protein
VSDGEDEAKTQTCGDCGALSPSISTNYTLIGAHGWRISRRTDATGTVIVEWWCPSCWAARKRASLPGTVPTSAPASRKRS